MPLDHEPMKWRQARFIVDVYSDAAQWRVLLVAHEHLVNRCLVPLPDCLPKRLELGLIGRVLILVLGRRRELRLSRVLRIEALGHLPVVHHAAETVTLHESAKVDERYMYFRLVFGGRVVAAPGAKLGARRSRYPWDTAAATRHGTMISQ